MAGTFQVNGVDFAKRGWPIGRCRHRQPAAEDSENADIEAGIHRS